jgi:hypothetical protein
MHRSSGNATRSNHHPTLNRRVTYALAATATTAMTAVPAHGQSSSNIVYTPTNIQFGAYDGGAHGIPIDLDQNGITDFGFLINNSIPGYSANGTFTLLNEPVGNGAITGQALNRGAIIGKQSGPFQGADKPWPSTTSPSPAAPQVAAAIPLMKALSST